MVTKKKKQSKDKKYVCVFYIYIHSKLKEKSVNGKIPISTFVHWIAHYRIPKHLYKVILWEMIQMGLLRKKGKGGKEIEIVNTKYEELLYNSSKLYNYLGLWS